MIPPAGLEPARLKATRLKLVVATNFTIGAWARKRTLRWGFNPSLYSI